LVALVQVGLVRPAGPLRPSPSCHPPRQHPHTSPKSHSPGGGPPAGVPISPPANAAPIPVTRDPPDAWPLLVQRWREASSSAARDRRPGRPPPPRCQPENRPSRGGEGEVGGASHE
jgi:hypothetical protein